MLAGNTAFVSDSCQLTRSRVNAAEHVGKQIEGVAGWRASGRSGGMAGAGDERGDLLAQAVSSRSSGGSISARLITVFRSMFSVLLLRRGAAFFFGACVAHGLDLVFLSIDRCDKHAVGVSLEVTSSQAGDSRDDDSEPDTRIDPGHATSPPAA
ncbi:hypothetical protein WM16_07825 [Burkholderia ubonensis]|uniref:Uncharacterized protein n=1 Tax=Burkholderia ubonensis TaxID=101571 RepID=A0A108CR92_9BURK|nr:hypothetical protein WM16_07825 [Burkholderia ubonensis]